MKGVKGHSPGISLICREVILKIFWLGQKPGRFISSADLSFSKIPWWKISLSSIFLCQPPCRSRGLAPRVHCTWLRGLDFLQHLSCRAAPRASRYTAVEGSPCLGNHNRCKVLLTALTSIAVAIYTYSILYIVCYSHSISSYFIVLTIVILYSPTFVLLGKMEGPVWYTI